MDFNFAKRNAIVLCGHTHHLELKEAKFPEGTITEMTMNSVTGLRGMDSAEKDVYNV